jgi:hypothetical protein
VAERRAVSDAVLGALLAAALTCAPPPAEADALRDACLGLNGQPPSSLSVAAAMKQNLTAGHYAIAKRQAQSLEATSTTCAGAGYEVDIYRYLHAFALMVRAQADLATGDKSGKALMERSVHDAGVLAATPTIDPDLKKLARDIVYGGHLELARLKTAKPGELMTPPPTAPP